MMVMTAKVDLKKIILSITAVAALILAAILMLGGDGAQAAPTSAPSVSSNDGRVRFLKDFGWDVTTSPTESGQVKIPRESSEVFDRYNLLQKGQGYDLTEFAGKNVMRYVYKINNFPGAAEGVYATLLVHKDRVIGGDVTNTAPGGRIQGLKMPDARAAEPTQTAPAASDPAVTTP